MVKDFKALRTEVPYCYNGLFYLIFYSSKKLKSSAKVRSSINPFSCK